MTISSTGASSTAGGAAGSGAAATNSVSDKQAFGAQVVTATLNKINSGSKGEAGKDADYDFQTKVLSAGAEGKGRTINGKV